MAIKVQINGQYTKFSGNMKALAQLDKKLKFRHPGAFFIRKKMGSQWDGMIHPLTKADRIKTGLLERSIEILSEFEEDFEVQDFRKHPQIKPTPDKINGLTLRPYQKESIETFLNNSVLDCPHRRGLGIMAVNSGKCIQEGSLIPVENKGLTPIEKVEKGDRVLTEFGFREVLGHEFTGEINTVSLTTNRGYTVVSGHDNHRIKIANSSGEWEWKFSRDFRIGDIIPIKYGDMVEGPLKRFNGIELNEDIAYLLGCIHGDGCLSRSLTITSHIQDIELLQSLERIIQKVFKKERGEEKGLILQKSRAKDNYGLSVGRNSLMAFLENFPELHGGAFEKRIPIAIFQSPIEVQRQYLRGYFDTDGSVSSSKKRVSISSVSKKGIEDTKQLLLNHGIISTYGLKKTSWQGGKKSTTNRLRISGLSLEKFKAIGFNLSRKKARLNEIKVIEENRFGGSYVWKDWDIFPEEFKPLLKILLKEAHKKKLVVSRYMWSRILRSGNNFTRYIVDKQLSEWVELKDLIVYKKVKELNSYFWDRVGDCSLSFSKTWDIEVEGVNSYIGNGFINHNTLIYMGIHLSVVDAKTLLIVDNTPLYTQLVKDFSEVFPDTYGYMKGGDVKWGDIMVVMSKTLVNRLDVFKKELSSFNVMLVDEADLGSSNTHQTIYAGLSGISIRLGLTGTAFMRNLAKDKLRNNTMLEEFGEPLYEISMKELEDLGVSSKTVIKILNGTSPPMDIKKWKSQKPSFIDEFNEVISYNPKRHELILNRVLYNLRCGRDKIMVFNKFKDQTEILYEYIRKRLPKKYKIAFTHSGIKGDALERFRDGDVNVLISSLYLKRGLNIPKIKTLINNSGGEFPSNPLQILGRGTRKHSSKDRVYFEDFQDVGKFLASHSRRRISYYKDRGLEIRDLRVKK